MTWDGIAATVDTIMDGGGNPLVHPSITGSMVCTDWGVHSVEWNVVQAKGWRAKLRAFTGAELYNAVHQAYHLIQFMEATGIKDVRDLGTILEIGGGYGALRKVIWELGHREPYTIVDLGPMLRMQEKYLGSIPTTYLLASSHELVGTAFAMWSLSEMPVIERDKALAGMYCRRLWFGFQDEFDGVDNRAYVKTMRPAMIVDIEHRPGNHYGLCQGGT